MKKILVWLVCALLLCSASLAETAGAPQFSMDEYPIVDGSTATLPLSYALIEACTGCSHEEAVSRIIHTKTTQSFHSLIFGDADLLIVYEPNAGVYDMADEYDVDLIKAPIGRDAMVFLINENNPVESLTQDEIVGIYTDEITNWGEVGGEDLPIVAYQRSEDSGSQVMMRKQVMKGIEMAEPPTELRPGEMGDLVDSISSYRNTGNAIGYSVYFYVTNMYMQKGIKLLSVDGVAPSTETIADGSYPYTQDFYAVIRADEPEGSPARRLFDYLQTEEGKALMLECNYVPVPSGD